MMLIIGMICCLAGVLFIGLGALMHWLYRQLTALLNQIPQDLRSMVTSSSPQATRALALLRLLPLLRWVGLGAGGLLILMGWIVYPTLWFLGLIALAGVGLYCVRGQIERRFSSLLQQQIGQAIHQRL